MIKSPQALNQGILLGLLVSMFGISTAMAAPPISGSGGTGPANFTCNTEIGLCECEGDKSSVDCQAMRRNCKNVDDIFSTESPADKGKLFCVMAKQDRTGTKPGSGRLRGDVQLQAPAAAADSAQRDHRTKSAQTTRDHRKQSDRTSPIVEVGDGTSNTVSDDNRNMSPNNRITSPNNLMGRPPAPDGNGGPATANTKKEGDWSYGEFAEACELDGGSPVFSEGTASCDYPGDDDIVCDAGDGAVGECMQGTVFGMMGRSKERIGLANEKQTVKSVAPAASPSSEKPSADPQAGAGTTIRTIRDHRVERTVRDHGTRRKNEIVPITRLDCLVGTEKLRRSGYDEIVVNECEGPQYTYTARSGTGIYRALMDAYTGTMTMTYLGIADPN